ncbi:MAG: APC family permease, partial [Clostridiales Family XIII bacterium]|nr:APC family permease [Clostridiales Family XIII bacterium]
GLGSAGAWLTGWTISLAYISVAAWEGIALSTAINYLFPNLKFGYLWNVSGFDIYISWSAVGIIGSVFLTTLNVIGIKPAAVFQMFAILLLLIVGMLHMFGGFAFGQAAHMAPAFTDMKGFGNVLLMTPSMYIGFDMVAKSAEEMNIPLKKISGVLIFAIIAAGAWYVLIILGTAMAAPASVLQNAGGTAADMAAYTYRSPLFAKILIIGGVCGIVTSWNGFIVGASRILFAMGRARMLPRIFGTVHPKYGTPGAAVLFVGAICCVTPLLGERSFIWLVNVAAFSTVAAYLLVSVSYCAIRRREPNLRKPFALKRGMPAGVTALLASLLFLLCYAPLSPLALTWPTEWGVILIWAALGLVFWGIRRYTEPQAALSYAEREALIFGEYAREGTEPGAKR